MYIGWDNREYEDTEGDSMRQDMLEAQMFNSLAEAQYTLAEDEKRANLAHESDTWQIHFTAEPKDMPYRPIYDDGRTWKPCLIIDGPNSEGYSFNARVVCDAAGALELLNFLKAHEHELNGLRRQSLSTETLQLEDSQPF